MLSDINYLLFNTNRHYIQRYYYTRIMIIVKKKYRNMQIILTIRSLYKYRCSWHTFNTNIRAVQIQYNSYILIVTFGTCLYLYISQSLH